MILGLLVGTLLMTGAADPEEWPALEPVVEDWTPEPLTPPPRPLPRWGLALPLSVPNGIGVEGQYTLLSWLTLWVSYDRPTPLRVKTAIRRRKLVDREGIIIRSPDIDLPFRVQLGPHQGLGIRLQPFSRPFYFLLGVESRRLTIDSTLQSHLEIVDSQGRMVTNTLFHASAHTRTDQTLLRSAVGYRWMFGETDWFFTFYSGWSQPLAAHSSIRTEVRVRNPEASNPANVDADNLHEAEGQQERVIYQKIADQLQKFERAGLPLMGISFGTFF